MVLYLSDGGLLYMFNLAVSLKLTFPLYSLEWNRACLAQTSGWRHLCQNMLERGLSSGAILSDIILSEETMFVLSQM